MKDRDHLKRATKGLPSKPRVIRDYIEYHNTDAEHSRPGKDGDEFSIFTRNAVKHLAGHRVWLISGEGKSPKRCFLEYVFTVNRVEIGEPNVVSGTEGKVFDPPIPLSGPAWFEFFRKRQQNFSLGLREIDSDAREELIRIARGREHASTLTDLERIEQLGVEDYRRALRDLEDRISKTQVEMLVGHANFDRQCISMQQLAGVMGWRSFSAANLQYGGLGRLFAEYFGVSNLANQTQALATGSESDSGGHFQWTLRDPLRKALREQWPDLILDRDDADQGNDPDELRRGRSLLLPTERAALIQARVGQGVYRRKLMELWQSRCAVTGCDIPDVLIASHAKPWRDCTNEERLDPYNGLLLAAHIDALFDSGLIGFGDTGDLLTSQQVSRAQLQALGIDHTTRLRQVCKEHKKYLAAHRRLHRLG